MKNKKALAMFVVKFLMSALLALILFYSIMYKSCALLPIVNDQAEKTILGLNEKLELLSNNERTYDKNLLKISKNKAFLFFENGSNSIEMFRTTSGIASENHKYVFNRPNLYCPTDEPCFCYCDKVEERSKERCNLQLTCKEGAMVCTSSNMNFSFQKIDKYFFQSIPDTLMVSHSVYFKGGFLISPSRTKIQTVQERITLTFDKKEDIVHLCFKDGNCDKEDHTNEYNAILNTGCSSSVSGFAQGLGNLP